MATYDNKVLTGDKLVYYSELVKTALAGKADASTVAGKQDALVFNTAYDATNNKVATMSDVAGKQDALTFNTAYNATSNKVATMADITSAIGGVGSFSFEIVQNLPSQDISTSKIYLVAKNTSGTNQVYTEYAYVNNAWEIIGDTAMTVDILSNAEIDTIWNTASAS